MAGKPERVPKALRELGKLLESLPANPAPKDVHKLRTVARRVEAIAAVLSASDRRASRRLFRSIEPVRKAAGEVRDMDVLISHSRRMARYSAGASLARLVSHLENARKESAAEFERTLDRRRKGARESVKQYSKVVKSALSRAKSGAPRFGGQPQEGVHSAAMKTVRELGDWPQLDQENIHAFRIKAKGLRYILQFYADADAGLVEALGEAQRRIGDWHDWQQLTEIAHLILNPNEDEALIARIAAIAKRKFDQAISSANTLRGRHLAMPIAAGA